jgi:prophage regulatory protein
MSRELDRKNQNLRRFYTLGEVEAVTSLSKATLYRKMARGTFPASIRLSEGRVGWDRRAVDRWCEGKRTGSEAAQDAASAEVQE